MMKQSIFYATVKSLDEMQKLALGGLKNSPVVANKLVKFLAKNTNVEAIDSLKEDVKSLNEENQKLRNLVSDLASKANEASKIANNTTNVISNHKNLITALDKRVGKLE